MARSSYKHICSHQNIQSETGEGPGNKIMWGAVKPGNKTMRGVSVIMGWKQNYVGCICHYGAGNRLQTVCKYGAGNKTMRGVSVINGAWNRLQSVIMGLETRLWGVWLMGLGTDYKQSVSMELETRLWGVCLSVWGWKQDYEGCVCQYGAGNRLQTICQ